MTSDSDTGQPQTARDWFAEARRCYLEEHQGCPCCHGRHCVFRARWGSRVEYHCNECDFSAAHDDQTGECAATSGREPGGAPLVLEGLWQEH
jgi:hypothetical protein